MVLQETDGLLEPREHAPLPVLREARGRELAVDAGAILPFRLKNLQGAKEVDVAGATLADVVFTGGVEATHARHLFRVASLPPRPISTYLPWVPRNEVSYRRVNCRLRGLPSVRTPPLVRRDGRGGVRQHFQERDPRIPVPRVRSTAPGPQPRRGEPAGDAEAPRAH